MTTTVTTADMSTRALDAITVVEAAKQFGLPVPFDVSFNVHRLTAAVHSLAELEAYAEHMGVSIEASTVLPDGRQHYRATGTIAGAVLTVNALDCPGAVTR